MISRFYLCLCLLLLAPVASKASEEGLAPGTPRHALSLFGAPKYPSGFTHFDYVNLEAPKGGRLKLAALGGFDSLNPFLIKGRPAASLGLIYDTLTTSSFDEPASEYGLVAKTITPESKSVLFQLRPEARFHDGKPIAPEDVIFSLETLKQAHPFYRAYYADITHAEKVGNKSVRFHFSHAGNRELPHIAGQLPILPKHFWQDKDFSAASLAVIPLGSGPYKISSFEAGNYIEYQRVESYWGKNLPVNGGQHNFDHIRIDYYGDDTVALEAFKARDYHFRQENTAKHWAQAYQKLKTRYPHDLRLREAQNRQGQGMQAYVFNLRRPLFADIRVRHAFALAFDFEWLNQHLFYNQYQRTRSFFSGSELASSGVPEGEERRLLEELHARFPAFVPAAMLQQAFSLPQHDDRRATRRHLRQAGKLLDAAGWRVSQGLRRNDAGEAMAVEFLLVSPAFERIVLHYVQQLKRLGINASVRVVDAAQYGNRLDRYDFDVIVHTYGQSLSPGNEQRDFWSSVSARTEGGRNMAGIENPAIDALIETLIAAQSRDDLLAATRALDRLLLWNHYVVPQWHIAHHRLAWWKPLAAPETLPPYTIGLPQIWWMAP